MTSASGMVIIATTASVNDSCLSFISVCCERVTHTWVCLAIYPHTAHGLAVKVSTYVQIYYFLSY